MSGELKQAIRNICRDLELPAGDNITQDWEYELHQDYRTQEYLERYVSSYSNPKYGTWEKYTLMRLILDVLNELHEQGEEVNSSIWATIESFLRSDNKIHFETMEHWSDPETEIEDSFSIAPWMRTIWRQHVDRSEISGPENT